MVVHVWFAVRLPYGTTPEADSEHTDTHPVLTKTERSIHSHSVPLPRRGARSDGTEKKRPTHSLRVAVGGREKTYVCAAPADLPRVLRLLQTPQLDQPHKLLHRCRGVRGGSDRIGAGMRARSQKLYGTYMRSYLDAGMLFTVSPWSAATASNSLKDADL